MRLPRRRLLHLATGAAALTALPRLARAEEWPTRTIRFIVPYPPGGNADVLGRLVSLPLQGDLGQSIVIENKGGAGGLIGAEAAAKSAPDGYTFLLSANGPVLYAPELTPHKPFDWRHDFVPVGTISLTSLALVVHPSVPATNLAEFFEFARREGDRLIFGVGGNGSSNHLFGELIRSQLNLKWTTAQYKGTAPAMNDLIGGHVGFTIDQVPTSLQLMRDGRVRALAVSGAKRVGFLPEVPTFVEQGYPNLEGYTFAALFAPAGTPAVIVAKVSAALKKVVRDPQISEQIAKLGAEPEAMSPEEFRAYLEKEDVIWLPVVRSVNQAL